VVGFEEISEHQAYTLPTGKPYFRPNAGQPILTNSAGGPLRLVPFNFFPISVNRLLDQGQKLLDEGKPREAAGPLNQALHEAPANVYVLLYSGLAAVDSGEVERGFERLERALELDPTNYLIHLFYARAFFDQGDLAGARRECERVTDVQPDHPGVRALRFLCTGRESAAQGLAGLALNGLSDDTELRGRALLLAEEALLPVETPSLTALWAGSQMPWELSSELPAGEPDGRAAEDAGARLKASLTENGSSPPPPAPPAGVSPTRNRRRAWERTSRNLQQAGALEPAIVFAEASMREAQDAEGRVTLARLYFEAARYAELEITLREFATGDPERNALMGISLFELGHFDASPPLLESGDPALPRVLHTLGRAHLILGDPAEARRAFTRAARIEEMLPANRVAHAYLHCRAAALQSPAPLQNSSETCGTESDATATLATESDAISAPGQDSIPADNPSIPADNPSIPADNPSIPADNAPIREPEV
jgi:tetratricopeptide (TPR) repeat protein